MLCMCFILRSNGDHFPVSYLSSSQGVGIQTPVSLLKCPARPCPATTQVSMWLSLKDTDQPGVSLDASWGTPLLDKISNGSRQDPQTTPNLDSNKFLKTSPQNSSIPCKERGPPKHQAPNKRAPLSPMQIHKAGRREEHSCLGLRLHSLVEDVVLGSVLWTRASKEVKRERPGFYVTRTLPLGFPGMDLGQLVKSVLPCGSLTEMK